MTAAANFVVLKGKFGPLLGATVISALVCIFAVWNVVNYSPRAIARLKDLSQQAGGRFSLWKSGTGDYRGTPFAHGAEYERFGILNYTVRCMPIEIGHLSSQVSARYRAPTGRRHAYLIVRLPRHLPHMIQSFGHLSRVLGVRVVPDQWHRSQRVDVGFGRRARLFVADGGERLARVFFTPELVQLFRRVGRSYDIEIKDQFLYLFSSRSVAAGGEDRWNGQRQLVDALAASMSDAGVWDHLRRQGLGQKDRFGEIRADVTRALAIVIGVMVVVVVVLSVLALRALGLLG